MRAGPGPFAGTLIKNLRLNHPEKILSACSCPHVWELYLGDSVDKAVGASVEEAQAGRQSFVLLFW